MYEDTGETSQVREEVHQAASGIEVYLANLAICTSEILESSDFNLIKRLLSSLALLS